VKALEPLVVFPPMMAGSTKKGCVGVVNESEGAAAKA
jgi:hypothetical protein